MFTCEGKKVKQNGQAILFPKVFYVDTGRFVEFQAVKADACWHIGLQLRPDTLDEVFDGAHLSGHKRHIQVQVFVVQLVNHFLLDYLAQFLYIVHKPGIGVRVSFDGDMQFKIMPVPVFIRATAEHFLIFLPAPGWVKEFMCRVKMFYSRDVHHERSCQIFAKLASIT